MYGPTGIEHLWTFAAQSDRFVDHERPGQLGTARREFCDDPDEKAYSFPRMTQQQQAAMYQLEAQGASAAAQVRAALVERWPCTNIAVLPDLLKRAGLSWNEYRGRNEFVQPLRLIRHVRFSPMYRHVLPEKQVLHRPEGRAPSGGVVADPRHGAVGSPAGQHVPRRELVGADAQQDHAELRVVLDGGHPHVGRLRRLLRSRAAAAPRPVRAGRARAGHRHLPVGEAGFIDGDTMEFASVLRLIETVFGLPPLTSRDADASDMLSAFDFTSRPRPPLLLHTRACPKPAKGKRLAAGHDERRGLSVAVVLHPDRPDTAAPDPR